MLISMNTIFPTVTPHIDYDFALDRIQQDHFILAQRDLR